MEQTVDGVQGGESQPPTKDVAASGSTDGIALIELLQFKRHKKLRIALTPGVNVIVGASDRGKSSVLHALGCAAVGDPDGSDLVRHGAPGYAVRLTFYDGTVLVRRRGKKGNTFALNKSVYVRDRGAWPPPQVTKAVRMCPQNFQWQLDGPLWFLDSAGTVAKQLNKVVDLEAIDAVLAAANSVAKKAEAEAEGAVQEQEAAKHAYRSLKWVPEMIAAWERLKQRRERLALTVARRDHLREQASRVAKLTRSKPPKPLFEAFARLQDGRTRAAEAKRKAEELKTVARQIETLRGRQIAYAAISEPFAALSALRAKAEQAARKCGELHSAVAQVESLQHKAKTCRKLLDEAKGQLASQPVCPACGQPTGSP